MVLGIDTSGIARLKSGDENGRIARPKRLDACNPTPCRFDGKRQPTIDRSQFRMTAGAA